METTKQMFEETGSYVLQELYNGTDGGAYNGSRYLANAIKVEENVKPSQGGIIVFNTDFDVINCLMQGVESFMNQITVPQDMDYAAGFFFKGTYTAPNGKLFDEDCLSLEILGVNSDTLKTIATNLCSTMSTDNVLIKDYSTGKVLLAVPFVI